jgi:hypothetical protein
MSKNSRCKREKPQGDAYVDIFIPPVQVPVSKRDAEPLSKSGTSIDDFIARKASEIASGSPARDHEE